MKRYQLTPGQNFKITKQDERRSREQRQRWDEYRRRIERLRRQIAEARRRRQRMLLLLLLAVLAVRESFWAAFQRSFTYQPDYDPEPKDWTPDPARDYAPRPGHDDHCDGYSYEEWMLMLGSGLIAHSQKITVAARAMAERKTIGHRS